jgi:hypothetical protein
MLAAAATGYALVVSPAERLRLPRDKEGQHQKSSNQFMLLFVSSLRVLSNICGRQSRLYINTTKLTILRCLKMGLVLTSPSKSHQTKGAVVADGVLKVMVPGQGRRMMGSGRMMVQLGRGPITFPTSQPSES